MVAYFVKEYDAQGFITQQRDSSRPRVFGSQNVVDVKADIGRGKFW